MLIKTRDSKIQIKNIDIYEIKALPNNQNQQLLFHKCLLILSIIYIDNKYNEILKVDRKKTRFHIWNDPQL